MDVSSTQAATAASTTTQAPTAQTATSSDMADYNTFLQLLIAQVRNQDPTNPTDAAQYVQQFAALSQVQQGALANQKLDQIITGLGLNKPTTPETPATPPADTPAA